MDRVPARTRRTWLLCIPMLLVVSAFPRSSSLAQDNFGKLPRDRSKPVAPRSEIIASWQKRQETFRSFRFAWTEHQTYAKGWLPNPRFPERERLNTPGLLTDRIYTASKTLVVDGRRMRYTFEIDRKAEADGVRITSAQGDNRGLGEGKHYSYVSVFDGQSGTTRLTELSGGPPPVIAQVTANVDAQNLDTRPIMMALRPLDPVMGHLLVDRAVTIASPY